LHALSKFIAKVAVMYYLLNNKSIFFLSFKIK